MYLTNGFETISLIKPTTAVLAYIFEHLKDIKKLEVQGLEFTSDYEF
jgi:hypothetical protein